MTVRRYELDADDADDAELMVIDRLNINPDDPSVTVQTDLLSNFPMSSSDGAARYMVVVTTEE